MKMKFTVTYILTLCAVLLGSGVLGVVCWLANSHILSNYPAQSHHSPITVKMAQLEKAIQIHAMRHNGRIPASIDELAKFAYTNYSYGNKPLLQKEDFLDVWGEPIEYERGKGKFILRSSGPDKEMGTKDDVFWGNFETYKKSWFPDPPPPVENPETNTVQEAASSSQVKERNGIISPPIRSVPKDDPQPEPTESKSAPWKLPLLLGVVSAIGVVTVWRFFLKRKT